jgi:hypothetical protein
VDVVQRVVAVLDLERLSGHERHHVRVIRAAVLIERHRVGRRRIGPARVLHVDEHVRQPAVLHLDRLLLQAIGVLGHALGIGGELHLSRWRTVPSNVTSLTGDGGRAFGRAAGRRCCRARRGLCRLGGRSRRLVSTATNTQKGRAGIPRPAVQGCISWSSKELLERKRVGSDERGVLNH